MSTDAATSGYAGHPQMDYTPGGRRAPGGRQEADPVLRHRLDRDLPGRRPARHGAAPEPGRHRPPRRQLLVRGDDRARPRRLRRLGRVRRDGLLLLGARRGGLPDRHARPPHRHGRLVDHGARRRRRRGHHADLQLRRLVGVPLPAAVRVGRPVGRPRHRVLLVLGAARRRLDHRLVRLDHRDRHRPGPRLRQERPQPPRRRDGPRHPLAAQVRRAPSRCPTRSSR